MSNGFRGLIPLTPDNSLNLTHCDTLPVAGPGAPSRAACCANCTRSRCAACSARCRSNRRSACSAVVQAAVPVTGKARPGKGRCGWPWAGVGGTATVDAGPRAAIGPMAPAPARCRAKVSWAQSRHLPQAVATPSTLCSASKLAQPGAARAMSRSETRRQTQMIMRSM